eukprot:m.359034 g.359034  ORF g.359034 m.359034 type:complete len:260 (-) comp18380_c0_seq1:214-993(-)
MTSSTLSNVRALVTGASSGLGRAVAERILASGGRVAAADLTSHAQELKDKYGSHRVAVETVDVTQDDQVSNILNVAREKFEQPINVVVNCAGIGYATRIFHPKRGPHPVDQFEKTLKVNTFGTFNVCRLAVPQLVENDTTLDGDSRAVIINTASIAAYEGQVGQVAYSASKGAIVGMTVPMARDLATSQVRVVTIAPGLFKTELLEQLGEAVCEKLGQQVPFPQRLGRPEEYARLVEHVITNPMINGEVLRIDGALRLP